MPRQRLPDGTFSHQLTPERHRRLVEGCRDGLFDTQNALREGVDASTLRSWVERGLDEDAEEPFRSFAEDYLRASIALEESIIRRVLDAAEPVSLPFESTEVGETVGSGGTSYDDVDSYDSEPGRLSFKKTKRGTKEQRGDWRAAAWFAERRWPLRWGNRSPDGGPKEALRMPDAMTSRQKKIDAMVDKPPPELVKRFREKGWQLVRIETPTLEAPPKPTEPARKP